MNLQPIKIFHDADQPIRFPVHQMVTPCVPTIIPPTFKILHSGQRRQYRYMLQYKQHIYSISASSFSPGFLFTYDISTSDN